jgi:hypothetical protein
VTAPNPESRPSIAVPSTVKRARMDATGSNTDTPAGRGMYESRKRYTVTGRIAMTILIKAVRFGTGRVPATRVQQIAKKKIGEIRTRRWCTTPSSKGMSQEKWYYDHVHEKEDDERNPPVE